MRNARSCQPRDWQRLIRRALMGRCGLCSWHGASYPYLANPQDGGFARLIRVLPQLKREGMRSQALPS